MCTRPLLLCLDEPAAGLNARESEGLNDLLFSIRAEDGIARTWTERQAGLEVGLEERDARAGAPRYSQHAAGEVDPDRTAAGLFHRPEMRAGAATRIEDPETRLAADLAKNRFFLENDLRIRVDVVRFCPALVGLPGSITHNLLLEWTSRCPAEARSIADSATRKRFI